MAERGCFITYYIGETYFVVKFGAVHETENRVGKEVKDFKEMGAVDSGICFLRSASKSRFISETRMIHGGSAWKNWGRQWN